MRRSNQRKIWRRNILHQGARSAKALRLEGTKVGRHLTNLRNRKSLELIA
jgi:hypothetical protein